MSAKNKRRKKSSKQSRANRKQLVSIADHLIDTGRQNYNHPARSTLAVIALNTLTCGAVGCVVAWALTSWIRQPADFTWLKYVIIAGVAAVLQVFLAFINSLVMTPIGVRISRRIMQRRLGVIFDDDQVEEVKRTVEPSSKIGPASIAAAAVVVALINQQAPTLAVFALGSAAGALSPAVSHLTNHKDIMNLWTGARAAYYRVTTRW